MIRIVIIEDEIPARKKLDRFINEVIDEEFNIREIDNVEMGIQFLQNNKVDLVISDIELLDGNSFEIYNRVKINCPIIFTTAYDQFWMNAFETNGIAYLLKPFSKVQFQKAWNKFLMLRHKPDLNENTILSSLSTLITQSFNQKSFKKRFTIQNQKGLYFLDTADIAYIQADQGILFAYDTLGKKHLLHEETLHIIQEQLDSSDFFRINRSELIQKIHIESVERYGKNSLSVKLKGNNGHLVASQSSTAEFRKWVAD